MVEESEKALVRAMGMNGAGLPEVGLLHSMAEMRRVAGNHAGAGRLLDEAIAKGMPEDLTTLYYMRGDCGGTLNMVSLEFVVFYRCRALGIASSNEALHPAK